MSKSVRNKEPQDVTTLDIKQLDLRDLPNGKHKKNAFQQLQRIIRAPNAAKEVVHEILSILILEADRKINQLEKIKKLHIVRFRQMQFKAVEDFKNIEKVRFFEAHKTEIAKKQFTSEMVHELEVIKKRELYSCYKLSKLKVSAIDCTTCNRRHSCWRGGKP